MEYIKCIVIGDGAVGKTSLLLTYTKDAFPEDCEPTIYDNYSANQIYKGRPTILCLWDTAGQHEHGKLRATQYVGADVFVICFALNQRDSCQNVRSIWHPEVVKLHSAKPIILVGTKLDTREQQEPKMAASECISHQQGLNMCKELGFAKYVECSARTKKGLNQVFDEAVKVVLEPRSKMATRRKCQLL